MTRALGILLLVPLGAFTVEAVLDAGRFEPHARAWGGTLAVAGGAALVSLLLGAPVGFVLAHHRRRPLLVLTFLPLLIPPALAAAGWMGLRLPAPGFAGCAVILASTAWPVVALLVQASLTRIPRSALEAAELHLSYGKTLRAVVWPHLRPALLGGMLLVFLLAASDFTVPSTFAVMTISYVIYERVSGLHFASAASAALPLVVLAILAAAWVRRIPVVPASGPSRPFLRGASKASAWAVAAGAWALTAVLPFAVCLANAGSPRTVWKVLAVNAEPLGWSAAVAGAAALLLVAWAALSPGRSRWEPLWMAGLVLPGIAAALGILALVNRLGLQPVLMKSGALLVWALMARFAYAAWLSLREPVERAQLEAAELFGLPRFRAWRKIVLPALRPQALSAFAIVFVLCLGEIGPSVLLNPPGRQTVVQHVFNWMHYGYDETVAALSLVLFSSIAAVTGLGIYAGSLRPTGLPR